VFANRSNAGKQLAKRLAYLRDDDVVVLGLPRGGVPVAAEVAKMLHAPLDVIVVRKLGVPFQPELGMGAIGEDNVRVINNDVVRQLEISATDIDKVEQRERAELERRAERFRPDGVRTPLAGRVVVIVDDGIATGSTAIAACQVAKAEGARRVILAVPVAPVDWTERLEPYADELVCLDTPYPFMAIGQFYSDFGQTSDDEVVACLRQTATALLDATAPVHDGEVDVQAAATRLPGHLTIPHHAKGLVVFAHGSGSSRHSPRNRYVATVLNRAGLATLLLDLLTPAEAAYRSTTFDIDLLGQRLVDVTRWVRDQPELSGLRVAYFGASTGAAAALQAAARPGVNIAAVVSRGGRPDLADASLSAVTTPTLLIVGGDDTAVIELNKQAQARLGGENCLAIIEGATHLFSEPGTLEQAADLARDWFIDHLVVASVGRSG
jgi:putative phosphoribosyl transferase